MNANDLKCRAEERKRSNGMIESPGCLVIFYQPNGSSEGKQYSPKKMGQADGSLFLVLNNNMLIMLPKDRCVIIDPHETPLMEQNKRPIFGGIEVSPEENLASMLSDAYHGDWLDGLINTSSEEYETNE